MAPARALRVRRFDANGRAGGAANGTAPHPKMAGARWPGPSRSGGWRRRSTQWRPRRRYGAARMPQAFAALPFSWWGAPPRSPPAQARPTQAN
jgi:hypothetical protein